MLKKFLSNSIILIVTILFCNNIFSKILFDNNNYEDLHHEQKYWHHSAANFNSLRYIDESQIDARNIAYLKEAFRFEFKIPFGEVVQSTPLQISDKLFFVNGSNGLISINAITGKKIWEINIPSPVGKRGFTGNENFLYVPTVDGVYEIHSSTGKLSHVYLGSLSVVSPIIEKTYLYFVSISGEIFKYNLITKKLILKNKIRSSCGDARIWSGFSFSQKENKLFLVTGNNPAFWGDEPTNCLANSLISINANNGYIAWIFQELKNDFWDLDMISNPMVIEDQTSTKVVALSKTGNVFIINAQDGKLLNPKIYLSSYKYNKHLKSNMEIDSIKFTLKDIKSTYKQNYEYITWKLRDFKEFNYKAAQPYQNVYLNGLHGGFEWPGGSIFNKQILVVASNKYPWVIRTEHEFPPKIFK
jgi:glucose dehydrogenase